MSIGFAEVHFKGTRKDYFTYADLELRPGRHVVVQADRGEDVGEVTAVGVIAGLWAVCLIAALVLFGRREFRSEAGKA